MRCAIARRGGVSYAASITHDTSSTPCQHLDTTRVRAERLAQLRAAMARHQVDAFIVPSADPHLSEYLPGRWQGREWLSGFTGSVGTFIATSDFAGVWTDGRYYTQAEQELAGTEHPADEDPVRRQPAAHRLAGREHASRARPSPSTRACWAWPWRACWAMRWTRAASSCAPTSTCWTTIWDDRPGLPPDAGVRTRGAVRRRWRAPTSCTPTRNAMAQAGRRAPLHLDPGRHRLPVQPARRRRQLQPGVPGARAGRADRRHPVRRRRQDRRRAARAPGAGRRARRAVRRRRRPRWPRCRPTAALLLDPRRVTAGMRAAVPQRVRVVEAINPTTFAKSRKLRRRSSITCARRWSRTAPRCANSSPGSSRRWPIATRAPLTEVHDRRAHHRRARAPSRLRQPQLRHHRRLQRQRRDHALPRHAGALRRHRRRRPAADRLRRPVPGRHHRHHARGPGRHAVAPRRSATSRWC